MRVNCSSTPYTQMYGIALHLARVDRSVLHVKSILLQCFNDTYNMLYIIIVLLYIICVLYDKHYTLHSTQYTLWNIQCIYNYNILYTLHRIAMEYLNKNDIFILYWPPQSSGVARGGRWRRSAPCGKIEDITRNLERGKVY